MSLMSSVEEEEMVGEAEERRDCDEKGGNGW